MGNLTQPIPLSVHPASPASHSYALSIITVWAPLPSLSRLHRARALWCPGGWPPDGARLSSLLSIATDSRAHLADPLGFATGPNP